MKKNKQTAEEILKNENLRVLRIISYDNILEFVFENIRFRALPAGLYFIANGLTLIILVILALNYMITGQISTWILVKSFSGGLLAGSIIVVPFHELLHAFVYVSTGAKRIRFGMDLKQMIFYVTADRYLTERRKFYLVALAPFLIFSIVIISLCIHYNNPIITITGISFLLAHNLMCIGDFAMIAYFHLNRKKELITFDIFEDKESFICERIKKERT